MRTVINAISWQEQGDLKIKGKIKMGSGEVSILVVNPDDDTVHELFRFLQPGSELVLSAPGAVKEVTSIEDDITHQSINANNHKEANTGSSTGITTSQKMEDFDPSDIGNSVEDKIGKKELDKVEHTDLEVKKPSVDFEHEEFSKTDFSTEQKITKEKRIYNDDGELTSTKEEVDDSDKAIW